LYIFITEAQCGITLEETGVIRYLWSLVSAYQN